MNLKTQRTLISYEKEAIVPELSREKSIDPIVIISRAVPALPVVAPRASPAALADSICATDALGMVKKV